MLESFGRRSVKPDQVRVFFAKVESAGASSVEISTAYGETASAVRCCDCSAGDTVLALSQGGVLAAIAKRRG